MRTLCTLLLILVPLLPAGLSAADDRRAAGAAWLEEKLGELLAGPRASVPWRQAIEGVKLIDYRLLAVRSLGPKRWSIDAALLFDRGAAPAGTVGFERFTAERYRLVMARRGDDLVLLRFTPQGRLRRLPAGRLAQ